MLKRAELKRAEIFENRSNINEKYDYVDIGARIIYTFHYFLFVCYFVMICDSQNTIRIHNLSQTILKC